MSLDSLLALSKRNGTSSKVEAIVTEERLKPIIPLARLYISFWREYPDLFVDFMQRGRDHDKRTGFKLFFYQRVFLRVSTRYKYVYAVYPRGYSKSFLSVLVLMIRCILYPGVHLFSSAGGKLLTAL